MKFIQTKISDVIIIEPTVFGDDRGYFLESFNLEKFEEYIYPIKFVQDNESKSSRGVLRGLHFQKPPFDQAKLVRVLRGKILDIFLDLRTSSPTYLQHHMIEISEKKGAKIRHTYIKFKHTVRHIGKWQHFLKTCLFISSENSRLK